MCCKEYGHVSNDCPKDPNLRTRFDPIDEDDRLGLKRETKKYTPDTQYLTQRMLTEFA
jgi:hypothetical protein